MPRILVVDDNEDVRFLVRRVLENKPFDLRELSLQVSAVLGRRRR